MRIKKEEKGYLCIVLHSHLPFVRHPEIERFLEEDWFYEAITETYIPLIDTFKRLVKEGVKFRIAFSLSPTLLTMFEDELLQNRYLKHIERAIELAHKEIERTRFVPEFQKLAIMYLNLFCKARDIFLSYNKNLINAFKELVSEGVLELITCSATHGYSPLIRYREQTVKAQVRVAVDYFKKIFGYKPKGFWLPECGYYPGLDSILKECGIRYFFVDTHAILHGTPRPKYGVYAPVYCKSGVAAFGRDTESSKQVWSSIEGYPGDWWYREFYRDIGFDLDFEYIKPYIHPDGMRINTGIKYYRITGNTNYKEIYIPEKAVEKAAEHAGHFLFCRNLQCDWLCKTLNKKPIIVAPYDTELFGHWWFEGPKWLEFLIKKIYYDQNKIKMCTPSDYLKENPKNQVVTPSESSWGWKGYHEVWLKGENDWIWPHLHAASERMTELVEKFPEVNDELLKRALNQALRELLLAYSSDWPFIMATHSHVGYAVKRVKQHILRFTKLYEEILSANINEKFLAELEKKDNIFPDIDYRIHR